MLRTQIYLPEALYTEINKQAKAMEISMAELIRRLVKKGLKDQKKAIMKKNNLVELAKLKIKGGPKNLSSKLDSCLYQ